MISVIIPVYNVKRLLPRCLDSLIAQTYTDWEAICVDDGSTDGSSEILDRYAANDGRFRVVHIENQGVSNARNVAMSLVGGEYVMIVDSDDFLHPQAMDICLNRIQKDGSDAVMFTYDHFYRTVSIILHFLHLPDYVPSFRHIDAGSIEYFVSDDVFSLATEYSHQDDIDPKWAIKHCQPWRGLYRTEIVRNVKFNTAIKMYEDFPWWSEVLLNIRRVTSLRESLYFYYPNFKGYVFSSSSEARIKGLSLAIEAGEKVYAGVSDEYRKSRWEKNFLNFVKDKLKKKSQE